MRGDLYRFRTPRDATGHEQRGQRFVVVLQSDALPLSTLIVAPTSTRAQGAIFRPEIDVHGTKTLVMLDQLTAVNPDRLGDFAGRLDSSEMRQINLALRGVLGHY